MRLSCLLPVAFLVLCSALLPAADAVRECAACHPAQAKPHPATSMAHALEPAAECSILRSHPDLKQSDGPYTYRIQREGNASVYSVTDGTETFAAPIRWAVGLGTAGQTYIYEKDGELYQSRMSYYRATDGLDATLGATNSKPTNLAEAAGVRMFESEQRTCFGCHATDAVAGKKVDLRAMTPGVQCERCHGTSDAHLKAVRSGNAAAAHMPHLGGQGAEEIANFCGQCHRTWEQIASSGIHGVFTVRFQPYRLTNSKCYDPDDHRIACTACHDPHREIDRSDAAYDRNCQACHAGGKPSARACKVGKQNCAGCHMPKIAIPGAHYAFTDHQIRIARTDAPYPD